MACLINFRGPEGPSVARFEPTTTLSVLREHVREKVLKDGRGFKLATTYPTRVLDDLPLALQLTCADLGLVPSATLVVQVIAEAPNEDEDAALAAALQAQFDAEGASAAGGPNLRSTAADADELLAQSLQAEFDAEAGRAQPAATAAAAAATVVANSPAAAAEDALLAERLQAQFDAEARRRGGGGGAAAAPPATLSVSNAYIPAPAPRGPGPSYTDVLMAPVRGIAELFSPSNLKEFGRSVKEMTGLSGGAPPAAPAAPPAAAGAHFGARTATLADLPADQGPSGRQREGAPQRVPGAGFWQFGPNPELERQLRQSHGAGGTGGAAGPAAAAPGANRPAFGNEAHTLADVRARRGEPAPSSATQQVVYSSEPPGGGDEPHVAGGGFGPISGLRTAWRALRSGELWGAPPSPSAPAAPSAAGRGRPQAFGANIHGIRRP